MFLQAVKDQNKRLATLQTKNKEVVQENAGYAFVCD
jgi:hypothetical protein